MTNSNRWGIAAGLAGAIALFGTAQAQTPGGGAANMAGTGQEEGAQGKDTTGTTNPGERSGWSGREANQTGTEPSGRETKTSGGQSDIAGGTAGSQGSTSSEATTRSGASATGQKVDKKLQEDIQKIHASNQAEVHMAQMGQQQATSSEVKQFAEKLEQDHQSLDRRLTQTAQAAGIQLEGKGSEEAQKDSEKHMRKLQGKTGQEFDKEFLSMMVKDHEKDIKAVQKAAKEAKKQNQSELASLLDQAATGMQGHLTTAKQLEDTVKQSGQRQSRGAGGAATGSGSTGSGSTSTGSSSGATESTKGAESETKPKAGQ